MRSSARFILISNTDYHIHNSVVFHGVGQYNTLIKYIECLLFTV